MPRGRGMFLGRDKLPPRFLELAGVDIQGGKHIAVGQRAEQQVPVPGVLEGSQAHQMLLELLPETSHNIELKEDVPWMSTPSCCFRRPAAPPTGRRGTRDL